MPTDKDKELAEVEAKLKSANDQIAVIAVQQAALSKDVQNLNKEKDELETAKSGVLDELVEITARIKEKEAERNESLNERDKKISDRETLLSSLEKSLHQAEDELLQKNAELETNIKYQIETEKETEELKARMIKWQSDLTDTDTILTEKSEALGREWDKVSEMEKSLVEQKKNLDKEESQVENDAAVNKEISGALQIREEQIVVLEERGRLISGELKIKEADLKKLSLEVDIKLTKAEENTHLFNSQMDTLNQESKRVELGWLRINQKIREKQLDVDLAELKK